MGVDRAPGVTTGAITSVPGVAIGVTRALGVAIAVDSARELAKASSPGVALGRKTPIVVPSTPIAVPSTPSPSLTPFASFE